MVEQSYCETAHVELHVANDAQTSAEEAADFFAARSIEAIRERGRFNVALSGGNTPAKMLDVLAEKYAGACDWKRIHFYWSDERMVPPDHERSNFHLAKTHLFSQIVIPHENLHRETTNLPMFDLIFLGIGEDGHTASLFPGSSALINIEDATAFTESPAHEPRMTFTYRTINAARYVAVLASGTAKKEIVAEVLSTAPDPRRLPIQGVRPKDGKLIWFLDRDAYSGM